jgi:hypothetical protein
VASTPAIREVFASVEEGLAWSKEQMKARRSRIRAYGSKLKETAGEWSIDLDALTQGVTLKLEGTELSCTVGNFTFRSAPISLPLGAAFVKLTKSGTIVDQRVVSLTNGWFSQQPERL